MSDENATPETDPTEETQQELEQEAIERQAEESDAGKPPEGGALAIKDVRYLGTGIKITEPDADGFQAVTYLIDSRTQHTYVFGPQTAAYIHEKTMSPEARALLADVPDPADAVIPEDESDA